MSVYLKYLLESENLKNKNTACERTPITVNRWEVGGGSQRSDGVNALQAKKEEREKVNNNKQQTAERLLLSHATSPFLTQNCSITPILV